MFYFLEFNPTTYYFSEKEKTKFKWNFIADSNSNKKTLSEKFWLSYPWTNKDLLISVSNTGATTIGMVKKQNKKH